MKTAMLRKETLIDLAVALAAALGVFIVAFTCRCSGINAAAPAVSTFFVLQPQSVTEEVISDYAGVRRTYTFDLESRIGGLSRTQTLFVYLRHTSAVLEMEGEVFADSGERDDQWHIAHTPGNYWLTLPIHQKHFSEPLRITLTPVYQNVRDEQPVFLLIDRRMLIDTMVLPEEGALLLLSLVAMTMGAFLMLLAFALSLAAQERRRVFYLGATALAAGVWKLCGLSAVPLLLDYYGQQKAIWFAGVVGYLLMMVLSLRLLTILRTESGGRVGRVCCHFASACAMLLLALQIGGVVEVHDVVVWYGIGMASLHLIALLGQKLSRSELLWLLPTFAALGLDLAIFLHRGTISTAPVFLVWIVLNLFVRGFGFLHGDVSRARELREKDEELRGAKMQAMISQIRPHFIYNTLASIHMICAEEPRRAMDVIEDFSDYLHANFTAIAATEPVAFIEELKHTEAYLNVESALYEDKLNVEYDTDYLAFSLPPLTLQPIVENSVKHGVGETHRAEYIVIRSRAARWQRFLRWRCCGKPAR